MGIEQGFYWNRMNLKRNKSGWNNQYFRYHGLFNTKCLHNRKIWLFYLFRSGDSVVKNLKLTCQSKIPVHIFSWQPTDTYQVTSKNICSEFEKNRPIRFSRRPILRPKIYLSYKDIYQIPCSKQLIHLNRHQELEGNC